MSDKLRDYALTQAYIKKVYDKKLGALRNGQTAVRYMRFAGKVKLDRLEMPVHVHGRMIPSVPVHPAHVKISVLNKQSFEWKTVKDANLPCDPEIMGEGLTQEMKIEEMEEHFSKIFNKPPYVIDLDQLETDHLRIECDIEHPVWPNHGEMNGGEYNVPFGIFDRVCAYGEVLKNNQLQRHLGLLDCKNIDLAGTEGVKAYRKMSNVYFESDNLKIGFSLRRPMLCFLGWDHTSSGKQQKNRLVYDKTQMSRLMDCYGQKMFSGPLISTFTKDCGCQQWTGEVVICGNTVSYRDLTCDIPGYSLNVTFKVFKDGFIIETEETCIEDIPVLEYEVWRFSFDESIAMTAVATAPITSQGRNGGVPFPVIWSGDECGCLCGRMVDGDEKESFIQVDSNREKSNMTSGFVTVPRSSGDRCIVVPKGHRKHTLEIKVTNLKPAGDLSIPDISCGSYSEYIDGLSGKDLKKYALNSYWQSMFSCFRPENGGFSNNAISVNCHVNQRAPAEIAVFTQKHESGLSPLEMYRFTIERAIMEGGGYGYWRNLFYDSDPILLSGVGRIYGYERDDKWLESIEPGIRRTVDRLAENAGDDGLIVCKSLSGNSGSYRWSSNAMDVVGFGHIDAYVNAWAYRGLKNGVVIMKALKDAKRSELCFELAEKIKKNYTDRLLNPETGWVAGWRSRDGMLHDYAFLFVNAPAIAFGLLDEKQSENALRKLEKVRVESGIDSFEYGIPHNLFPISNEDHMLPLIIKDLSPTFERYTDGAMSAGTMEYYLRALSKYGFEKEASVLSEDYCRSLIEDNFTAGIGVGKEFHSWEGIPIGYEGTFVSSFTPLYAVAVEIGVIQPKDPEWWLDDGGGL